MNRNTQQKQIYEDFFKLIVYYFYDDLEKIIIEYLLQKSMEDD